MSTPLHWLSASELVDRFKKRTMLPSEYLTAIADRIELVDPILSSFVTVSREQALSSAEEADAVYGGVDDHRKTDLCGVPVAVKDSIPVRGFPTSYGAVLGGPAAEDDAAVVERARASGMVVLGKTNLAEWGWTTTSVNAIGLPTRNPIQLDRSPGGSSSGAAAAIAAGFGPIAIGTDSGGSVRIPAAFCGVVGFKPSRGVIPRYPTTPWSFLSEMGILARTVGDVQRMLSVTGGYDPRDRGSCQSDSWSVPREPLAVLDGLTIGWTNDFGFGYVDPEVADKAREAVGSLSALGVQVVDLHVDLADPHPMVDTILMAGQRALIQLGLDDPFARSGDADRREMLSHATGIRGADLAAAMYGCEEWSQSLSDAASEVDLIASPSVGVTAFGVHESAPESNCGTGAAWAGTSYALNVPGWPAVSLPAGRSDGGLPIGVQLAGPLLSDYLVLGVAHEFERLQPWDDLREAVDASLAAATGDPPWSKKR